jgi:hypothetical protein
MGGEQAANVLGQGNFNEACLSDQSLGMRRKKEVKRYHFKTIDLKVVSRTRRSNEKAHQRTI